MPSQPFLSVLTPAYNAARFLPALAASVEQQCNKSFEHLVIDPKGDLGNLLLTFPELSAADFAPWVDAGDAARKGVSVDDLAATTATHV